MVTLVKSRLRRETDCHPWQRQYPDQVTSKGHMWVSGPTETRVCLYQWPHCRWVPCWLKWPGMPPGLMSHVATGAILICVAFAVTWGHDNTQAYVSTQDHICAHGPSIAKVYIDACVPIVPPKATWSLRSGPHPVAFMVFRTHASVRTMLIGVPGATT